MSDYIDKLSATSIPVVPKEHRKQFIDYDDAFETGWNEALACVNMIPSADVVEVRHGRWKEYGVNNDNTHNIACSICGHEIKSRGHANSVYTELKYRYCPYCGARMDGGYNE